jgi:hypothetical protein
MAFVGLVGMGSSGGAAERGPVGYWAFDEGEGLTVEDASGNGCHGRILNQSRGVTWTEGRNGRALEFAGGDPAARNEAGCVALDGLGEINWSAGLTVEAWVRFTKLDRPNTYEIVSNALEDRGPGFRFMLAWASLSLRSGEGGEGRTWGASSDPAATSIGPGEWYHLAGTYDGSRFRAYVDGVLVGQSDADLQLATGDGTVYVGAYRGGYAYGLDAVVDDMRLYDYARSPEQIIMDARLSD